MGFIIFYLDARENVCLIFSVSLYAVPLSVYQHIYILDIYLSGKLKYAAMMFQKYFQLHSHSLETKAAPLFLHPFCGLIPYNDHLK